MNPKVVKSKGIMLGLVRSINLFPFLQNDSANFATCKEMSSQYTLSHTE